MKDLFIQMWPSLVLQSVIILMITHLLFWFFGRGGRLNLTWQQTTVAGLAIAFLANVVSLNQLYQTRVLLESLQISSASEASKNPLNQKAEFLALVDQLAGNPSQITDDTRKKLFEKYKALFPAGVVDMVLFRDEIKKSYMCHAQLFQDLVDAIEKKTVVKSMQTQMCETYSGEFYHRPKLYSDDVLREHEQAMKALDRTDKAAVAVKVEQLKIRFENVDKIFR